MDSQARRGEPGLVARPVMPGQEHGATAARERDDDREQKLAALRTRLHAAAQAAATADGWAGCLRMAARLPGESFANVLLIGAQRPDATMVRGYEAWRAAGRQVLRDEPGIAVFPAQRQRPAARSREARPAEPGQAAPDWREATRVTYVWDISQTTGQPVPGRPVLPAAPGEASAEIWDALCWLARREGYTVEREYGAPPDGVTFWTVRRIRILPSRDSEAEPAEPGRARPGQPRGIGSGQAVWALAHQLGHVLVHDQVAWTPGATTSGQACQGARKAEADAIACITAMRYGIAVPQDLPAPQSWAGTDPRAQPAAVILAAGERITAAAARITSHLDHLLPGQAVTPPAQSQAVTTTLTQPRTDTDGKQAPARRERMSTRSAPRPARRGRVGSAGSATASSRPVSLTSETAPGTTGTSSPAILAGPGDPGTRGTGPSHQFTAGTRVAPPADRTRPAAGSRTGRILLDAQAFYETRLPQSWVPGYLRSRGIDAPAAAHWQMGYAPAGWTALVDRLRGLGHADQDIEAAGLARRSSRRNLIDFFRDRVMLPVHDEQDSLAGFIGRAHPSAGPEVPRYLNSPQSPRYRKGELLFGLKQARGHLAAGARPVIVEGPFDVIAVSLADPGRHAGLAPCGTALTGQHAAVLSRAVSLDRTGVLVAFDDDPAGRRAAARAYGILRPVSDRLETAVLSDRDPAQIFQEDGASALRDVLSTGLRPLAVMVIDAAISERENLLHDADGPFRVMQHMAGLIAGLLPAGTIAAIRQITAGRQLATIDGQMRHVAAPELPEITRTLPSDAICQIMRTAEVLGFDEHCDVLAEVANAATCAPARAGQPRRDHPARLAAGSFPYLPAAQRAGTAAGTAAVPARASKRDPGLRQR